MKCYISFFHVRMKCNPESHFIKININRKMKKTVIFNNNIFYKCMVLRSCIKIIGTNAKNGVVRVATSLKCF